MSEPKFPASHAQKRKESPVDQVTPLKQQRWTCENRSRGPSPKNGNDFKQRHGYKHDTRVVRNLQMNDDAEVAQMVESNVSYKPNVQVRFIQL